MTALRDAAITVTWRPASRVLTDEEMRDAFRRYVDRHTADNLRSTEPPEGWPGSSDSWRELRALAISGVRASAAAGFLGELDAGWTVWELASGQPAAGTRQALVSGRPLRPPVSHIPVVLQDEASAAQRAMAGLPENRLTPVYAYALEKAAIGDPACPSAEVVKAAIAAAREAIAAHESERRATQQNAAVAARVRILGNFGAAGLPDLEVGRILNVTAAQLDALRQRQAKEPDRDPLFEVIS
jgi:hypothetical protein